MRRMRVRLQAVVIAAAMTVGTVFGNGNIPVMAADADETVAVQVQLTYGQTEARGMLEAVNAFRQGNESWAWNENDTEKITYSNLGALSIDPVLEQIAMLRAAEIALSYSHTRPNGQKCFTAYSGDMEGGYRAENIAAGYSSAEAVFEGWQETEKSYSGQGHRRNMLGSNYVSIGIGHVTYQGIQYWVQEFSSKSSGGSLSEANNSTAVEEIEVLTTKIQSVSLNKSEYSLTAGEKMSLEELKILAKITDFWSYRSDTCMLENADTITTDDEEIASVENGILTAKSAGTTTLIVSALGQKLSIPVTVAKAAVTPTKAPDPSTSDQPKVSEAPFTSTQPSTTECPTTTQDPNTTGKPTETQKPDTTGKPMETQMPDTTDKPMETQMPGTTGKPTETQMPDTTDKPMETQDPNTTNIPNVTQNPNNNPSHPTVTGNPGESGKKDGVVQTVNPLKGKKVKGIKVKQKRKSGKLTIRYQRMKKAKGYCIIYAWNKKFTKHRIIKNTKSTSLVLSALKHKKVYYIKVCAYTLDKNGRKQYSADSKIIKYKIK